MEDENPSKRSDQCGFNAAGRAKNHSDDWRAATSVHMEGLPWCVMAMMSMTVDPLPPR